MDYDHSIRINPYYQYAYSRQPLYVLVDRSTTEITTCGFWLDLDGSLDAPECLPTGSTNGSGKHGPDTYKDFVSRGYTKEDADFREKLAEQLISEIFSEINGESV